MCVCVCVCVCMCECVETKLETFRKINVTNLSLLSGKFNGNIDI